MTKKMFITDFDGVLCDSVLETLLVTYNAYHHIQSPDSKRILQLDAISAATQLEFRRLRPYLKGAEDFIPMFLAIEQDKHITSQQDFDEFKAQYESLFPTYLDAFYAERNYLQTCEQTTWLKLNPVFDGLADTLRQRESFEHMYILTTKRQHDVVNIFESQQIAFPLKQIVYMKAAGKSKKLVDMLHENEANMKDAVYFEDQLEFLVASQQHGIGSYLVGWGYVSEEQKALAHTHQIPIITLRQFDEMLRDF